MGSPLFNQSFATSKNHTRTKCVKFFFFKVDSILGSRIAGCLHNVSPLRITRFIFFFTDTIGRSAAFQHCDRDHGETCRFKKKHKLINFLLYYFILWVD